MHWALQACLPQMILTLFIITPNKVERNNHEEHISKCCLKKERKQEKKCNTKSLPKLKTFCSTSLSGIAFHFTTSYSIACNKCESEGILEDTVRIIEMHNAL